MFCSVCYEELVNACDKVVCTTCFNFICKKCVSELTGPLDCPTCKTPYASVVRPVAVPRPDRTAYDEDTDEDTDPSGPVHVPVQSHEFRPAHAITARVVQIAELPRRDRTAYDEATDDRPSGPVHAVPVQSHEFRPAHAIAAQLFDDFQGTLNQHPNISREMVIIAMREVLNRHQFLSHVPRAELWCSFRDTLNQRSGLRRNDVFEIASQVLDHFFGRADLEAGVA